MNILEARNLTKTYTVDRQHIRVLDDVSMEVSAGEFLVITGASGSGKTTLLTLLSGLDHPSSGKVLIDGQDITDATEDELAPMRNKIIGFVFQSFHLVPSMTARENIMFPAELLGDDRAFEKADRLLERMGLSDRGDNLPSQLSGGEKQRIAIARVILKDPSILVLDEATSHLDTRSEALIQDALEHLMEGRTSVVIAHRLSTVKAADKILVIDEGRLVESGTHEELLESGGLYRTLHDTQLRERQPS